MNKYLTTLFILVFGALLLAPLSFGADCGVGGTAKNVYGVPVTKTDQEATQQKARIGEDGYWWTCGEESKPVPADCYPATSGAFRVWTVDGRKCTTLRKGASPTDPARDRVIRHGETSHWQQWTGPMRGQLIEWCHDGQRHIVGSSCAPVTHCDNKWSTSSDGGKTVYVVDARAKPVAIGAVTHAVAADGKTIQVTCTNNGFRK